MNIKDIAKLANVSPSTVSKVLNNKDDTISEKTREQVLSIAKKHNYRTYSGIKTLNNRKSFIIALVLNYEDVSPLFIHNLQISADRKGYSLVIYDYHNDQEIEKNIFDKLKSCDFDGLVYFPGINSDKQLVAYKNLKIPKLMVNPEEIDHNIQILSQDYGVLAKNCTDYCIEKGHKKIGLALNITDFFQPWIFKNFLNGYVQSLAANNITYNEQFITKSCNFEKLIQEHLSIIICQNNYISTMFYDYAQKVGLSIPNEISVLSVREQPLGCFYPKLCSIHFDEQAFAEKTIETIVDIIEKKSVDLKTSFNNISFTEGSSVKDENKKEKIVVVGTINMDMVAKVPRIATEGKTIIAQSAIEYPGGKAANQAVSIGKLDGNVFLVGCIGKDSAGRSLVNTLTKNGVNIDAVKFEDLNPSGKAFINVTPNGESSITVFVGANRGLDVDYLESKKNIFIDADYCLLQTELDDEIVLKAAELASEQDVKVILKPSAKQKIEDSLLQKTFLLVPNEKEAEILLPNIKTLEEKALYFLEKGVQNVIITLSERGCYFCNSENSKYFPAYGAVEVIDTTGGADAFIGALVTCLANKIEMDTAIEFANYAAGLSTTKYGSQEAMASKTDLDTFLENKKIKI